MGTVLYGKEEDVFDDEGEEATALFIGPAKPAVAVAQAAGGGAED